MPIPSAEERGAAERAFWDGIIESPASCAALVGSTVVPPEYDRQSFGSSLQKLAIKYVHLLLFGLLASARSAANRKIQDWIYDTHLKLDDVRENQY